MADIGETRRRSDLIADGLTRHEITRAESEGWLLREGRSVYRFAVTGLRLRMELIIARAPDVVFSHRIAAFEHGLLRNPPARLDVMVSRARGTVAGAHVWRRDGVQSICVRGMRVTSIAQTLVDMVDEWGIEVTARILDDRFPTMEARAGILRYIDDDVELDFDRFIDEICSTIDWLLGQPLRTSDWDERHCEDLYVARQIHWEERNQAPWPHW